MSNKRGVREHETPWNPTELKSIRVELEADRGRLATELAATESGIAGLVNDSGDGAGDDLADVGSKTFEREQEMSLASNARELLIQTERALHRFDEGTYGICESCGGPIGKARLQAFPRATLCIADKQAAERS
jgi:DnaK suppressor protein